jgi:outer membrane protein OmpA-like peptidoglycan-associated protein
MDALSQARSRIRCGTVARCVGLRCSLLTAAAAMGVLGQHIAVGAELLNRDSIIQQLTPAEDEPKLRSIMVVPTEPPSVNLDIKFEFDSAKLTDEAVQQLTELGAALASKALGAFKFEVAGHTDAWGSVAYNQKLSERRSESVKHYLVEQFTIDPERLKTAGWGFQRPKDPENPKNPENRRVEVTNLGK